VSASARVTVEQWRQFALQSGHAEQPRHVTRLELDQHIHVAVGAKVGTQHRAKQRQAPDVVLATEVHDLLLVDRDMCHAAVSSAAETTTLS
jgi:hypothetical protein